MLQGPATCMLPPELHILLMVHLLGGSVCFIGMWLFSYLQMALVAFHNISAEPQWHGSCSLFMRQPVGCNWRESFDVSIPGKPCSSSA